MRPDIVPGDPVPIEATLFRHDDGSTSVTVYDGREMLVVQQGDIGRRGWYAVRYLDPKDPRAERLRAIRAELYPKPALEPARAPAHPAPWRWITERSGSPVAPYLVDAAGAIVMSTSAGHLPEIADAFAAVPEMQALLRKMAAELEQAEASVNAEMVGDCRSGLVEEAKVLLAGLPKDVPHG